MKDQINIKHTFAYECNVVIITDLNNNVDIYILMLTDLHKVFLNGVDRPGFWTVLRLIVNYL